MERALKRKKETVLTKVHPIYIELHCIFNRVALKYDLSKDLKQLLFYCWSPPIDDSVEENSPNIQVTFDNVATAFSTMNIVLVLDNFSCWSRGSHQGRSYIVLQTANTTGIQLCCAYCYEKFKLISSEIYISHDGYRVCNECVN